ncbi:hypothetical protein BG844_10485 [Couchioplanes caeruleus subsp. caeruleus]|uniref:Uncharacterized protein n=1 Tax=Couchioplanes caeruleus subsp. caeruleus TaxID=56427 RepID=A0A1K0GAM0_9ACTN|nr:hypothetical protein BG844_10485 [Couchioplanes caeruleus subsp. caeruleus]
MLVALVLALAFFGISTITAGAASAAERPVLAGLSAADAAKARPMTVQRSSPIKAGVGTEALPGFCSFEGVTGATQWLSCSVVIPATVFVYCTNGLIFYGYLPAPGIYSLSATPCVAYDYDLIG